MLLTLFLTCAIALAVSTLLLLAAGRRLRVASRPLGLLVGVGVALAAGELAARIWNLSPNPVLGGEAVVAALTSIVVAARPQWNPVGQAFFGTFLAAILVYLAFALYVTFGTGLSAVAAAASFVLFLMELGALFLASSFAFESLDVICRVKASREIPDPDPNHQPFVSLQIAAYNEPPDMLIETIKSVEAIDYPSFEVVVIDNNTTDPKVWKPVEQYCAGRDRVKFVHVEGIEGFKSGALNHVMREGILDPRTEIAGVIDADYLVDPAYLRSLVGYFADPKVAFVQSPQDYRDYEGDAYLTACYDAYKYFFATSMPSRNQRNSIIFAGTMGLLRLDLLWQMGGWNEWCITEDAETSLRLLMAGYDGIYVARSFGTGIMPLTFAAFKSQRFRWCFGGMQILRMHWRDLVPWNRDPRNHLSPAQRFDYFLGGVQWLNDLIYFGFSGILLASVVVLLTTGHIAIRPLLGLSVLLPAALIASGLVRALWALRVRTGIGLKRATLAFLNWLSVSWTVAIACLQGLVRKRGVFMRTPKSGERRDPLSAVWTAKTETVMAGTLWGAGAVALAAGKATPFLLGLLAWQGIVYAAAPVMSLLNTRSHLTPELERRRRTESMRERFRRAGPYLAGVAASVIALAVFAALVGLGGSHPGPNARNPFTVRHAAPGQGGPIGNLIGGNVSPGTTLTPSPTVTLSPTVSGPSPSPTVTPSPTLSPSPTPTTSPSG
jgi:cellulose synthase/poly-beta-1,6-N-acetylglucosamine synthase-like glycosyltransferase